MTSPSPAFRPVEPPSGRIICSLRAPELSATSSIDLIITAISLSPSPWRLTTYCYNSGALQISLANLSHRDLRHQRGTANDFLQAPAFQLRQRTSFLEANHVA